MILEKAFPLRISEKRRSAVVLRGEWEICVVSLRRRWLWYVCPVVCWSVLTKQKGEPLCDGGVD